MINVASLTAAHPAWSSASLDDRATTAGHPDVEHIGHSSTSHAH